MGLKKKHSDFPKRVRLPITFDILHKMCTLLRKGVFNLFIDSLLEAACVVAFLGFLRCGEFTVLDQFDSDTNLCYNDVQVTNECIFLLLKKSKTDPFKFVSTIHIYHTHVYATYLFTYVPVSLSPVTFKCKQTNCQNQHYHNYSQYSVCLKKIIFNAHPNRKR